MRAFFFFFYKSFTTATLELGEGNISSWKLNCVPRIFSKVSQYEMTSALPISQKMKNHSLRPSFHTNIFEHHTHHTFKWNDTTHETFFLIVSFLCYSTEKAVRYFADEYPSKNKDKLLGSAEVGRSYFKLVSHLRGCISFEWSNSVKWGPTDNMKIQKHKTNISLRTLCSSAYG